MGSGGDLLVVLFDEILIYRNAKCGGVFLAKNAQCFLTLTFGCVFYFRTKKFRSFENPFVATPFFVGEAARFF